MKLSFAISTLTLLLLASCESEGRAPGQAGSDSKFVGGPCMNNTECEFLLCQPGPLTPGGTCTSSCSRDQDCSAGSSCAVTENGWYCLVNCASNADCRTDYSCQQLVKAPAPTSEEQEPSFVSVCFGAL